MRILVVEDEKRLAGFVSRALSNAGHTVESRGDGAEGLTLAKVGNFDLIVLDVNLPSLDGFSILKQLRAEHLPSRVLMLTARGEVGDRVIGLRAGADDYLVKPFAMEELLARIVALGRRGIGAEAADVIIVGELRMDVRHRHVTFRDAAIDLSPREFEVLQLLMEEPGRAFSRDELCERIWERPHEYSTRTVEVFIGRLRKKLEACHGGPGIETARGTGYRLQLPS